MNSNTSKNPKKIWHGGFLTLSHVRDIILIALLFIISWKLLSTDIKLDFGSINLNDFLSVILAIFAISLSVAFYFKATDTSNKFYDNSYAFTKEISEILGRIEAGFGEKLKHIDEGNIQLRAKMDSMPFNVEEAKEEEKKEEKNIREQEDERDKIILDLMEKAQVADDKKEELLEELRIHEEELDKSKLELNKLTKEINKAESSGYSDVAVTRTPDIELKNVLGIFKTVAYSALNGDELFDRVNKDLQSGALTANTVNTMKKNGLINNHALTHKGKFLFQLAFGT